MRTTLLATVISVTICGRSASQSAGSVAPIGTYSVVPELPGMGRPVDNAAVAARRRALLKRIGRGSILVPASHERNIEQDYVQDNDFRQNNTFFYLTELETQDAWLLLTARGADTVETVLFLPPRTPSQERWTGLRLGPDSVAVRVSGIGTVLPLDSLDNRLRRVRFAAARGWPVYVPLGPGTRDESRIADLAFSGADVRNVLPIVDSMRVVKDADEIARLRRAVDISVAGHIAAMRAARPGMYEYEIEAALEDGFRRNGADRVGYPSIVGSGPNSTTLHYDVSFGRPLEPGVVITLEPGIYLQAEKLGVRIEDDVLVTATGGEWLSAGAPRSTEAIERVMRGR